MYPHVNAKAFQMHVLRVVGESRVGRKACTLHNNYELLSTPHRVHNSLAHRGCEGTLSSSYSLRIQGVRVHSLGF